MCGVAGAFAYSEYASLSKLQVVERLNHAQYRRGPDSGALWVSDEGSIALGHRRLSIIDLSGAGIQPLHDFEKRWTISYNGEIYNYLELRQELETLGRRFRTSTDTEVLINVVAEWGEAGLKRLRGMFAFALWDHQERELWLVRDAFGVKPLYWGETDGILWFASQARALAQHAPVSTKCDSAGLVGFYLWGAVPEPFTWWEGVRLLPAGHVLRIKRGQAIAKPKCYYRVSDEYQLPLDEPISDSKLRACLLDSIRRHLIADVPVGVFLSSGIDSTAIAELAAAAKGKIQTVCLAFDDFFGTEADEAPLAEETALLLDADHRTVRMSQDDVMALIDDFLSSMDQPTTDGLNNFLVSHAAAAAGLKVALSGLGGDELFRGYPAFTQIPKLLRLGRATPLRSFIGELFEGLGPILSSKRARKLRSVVKCSGNLESAYFLRRCLHLQWELDQLLDPHVRDEGLARLRDELVNAQALSTEVHRSAGLQAAISEMEITRYMRNQPLRDTDWASMAHSLEVRVPFLDIPLFRKIAPTFASQRPITKKDLARCVGPVTRRLANRPKTGFTTPIGRWCSGRGGLQGWASSVARYFDNLQKAA